MPSLAEWLSRQMRQLLQSPVCIESKESFMSEVDQSSVLFESDPSRHSFNVRWLILFQCRRAKAGETLSNIWSLGLRIWSRGGVTVSFHVSVVDPMLPGHSSKILDFDVVRGRPYPKRKTDVATHHLINIHVIYSSPTLPNNFFVEFYLNFFDAVANGFLFLQMLLPDFFRSSQHSPHNEKKWKPFFIL